MRLDLAAGHTAAFFSVFVWGITFVSTKILLREYTPLQILFLRFLLGFITLWLLQPRLYRFRSWREEGLYACAGLSGVTLYFLAENNSLAYTTASNAGVIVTTAPFFTALLVWLFADGQKPGLSFYAGFVIAITGISILCLNGSALEINPLGDFLALLAAFFWGIYSIFTRKLTTQATGIIGSTMHIFFYGLLFMMPLIYFENFAFSAASFLAPENLGNLLFLGLLASAICYALWSFSVKRIGAVPTSVYIYLTPVFTLAAANIALGERLSCAGIIGSILAITGLIISEFPFGKQSAKNTKKQAAR